MTEVIYQLIGFNKSIQSIKQLGAIIDNIPVVIISSTEMEIEHPLREGWYESQNQWLNRNSYSKIMKVSSDHFIQLKKPQVVCDEIVGIVNY
jgi:hypothetical protein